MAAHDDSRLARIDRFSFGRLASQLLGMAMGSAVAVGIIISGFLATRDAPTAWTALSVFLATGPIAGWGIYVAGGVLLSLVRQFQRRQSLVDLDADIVIPRRMPARMLPTLGTLWFILFFGSMTLSKLMTGELGTFVAGAFLLFIFVCMPVQNLWKAWRQKPSAFGPIMLEAEGLLDRSYIDARRIPWRDIAAIDLKTGLITLTGETKAWAETRVPDRRWFANLRGPRAARLALNPGLQPDGYYALSLIEAYWQRRMTQASFGVTRSSR